MFDIDRGSSPIRISNVISSVLEWWGRDKTKSVMIDLSLLEWQIIKLDVEIRRR